MGKIIYLISVLKTIDWLTIVGFIIGAGVVFYLTFEIEDDERNTRYHMGEMKEFYIQKYNEHLKTRKIAIIVMLICVLLQVLIPAKEEMYLIALTKDYDKEDIYQMSKNEMKDSVDYIFDKLEGLKND